MTTNVVGMLGGLGNQMFQFAFGKWLEHETNRRTFYDLSAFRSVPSYFSLGNLDESVLPRRNSTQWYPHPSGKYHSLAVGLRRLQAPFNIILEETEERQPGANQLKKSAWFYGYWQTGRTTLPALSSVRRELLPYAPILSKVTEGIAVHVRRGDMLDKTAAVNADYFKNALDRLKDEHSLTSTTAIRVFSDDPQWCIENLNLPSAVFITGRSAFQDLTDMASHEYLVLSGSTFSWWAAHLTNRDSSTVAAPNPLIPGFDPSLENPGWLRVARDDAPTREGD
jgi:hypothetical protein